MKLFNDGNVMQRAGLCIRLAKVIQMGLQLRRKVAVHGAVIHDLVTNVCMFGIMSDRISEHPLRS